MERKGLFGSDFRALVMRRYDGGDHDDAETLLMYLEEEALPSYTAFCRDVVRGVDPQWVRGLYDFAVRPDIAFYFSVPLQIAMQRIFRGRPTLKYYEAGMDLALSRDPAESYVKFQTRITEEYARIGKEYGLVVVHGDRPIERQQRQIRKLVVEK